MRQLTEIKDSDKSILSAASAIATATDKAKEPETVIANPVAGGADDGLEFVGTAPVEDTHCATISSAFGSEWGTWAWTHDLNPDESTVGSGQGVVVFEAGAAGVGGVTGNKNDEEKEE
ncbi:hypothetical protein HK104_009181 [Borealophlyctis nickersoniae]|nr:hypothetical protein HK104_009181 [Borealophlyctis nickersoniae]